MRNHVCWKRERLPDVIDTEALQAAPHYFLACHSPVEMREARKDTGQPQRTGVSQEALLGRLLEQETNHIQMMVLGTSGTGKSHLVRWMYLHCPETDKRRVLLVPKSGTNLRRVVHSILAGLQGAPFDEFRARIERAAETITPPRARQELLAALAINVGTEGRHSAEPWRDPDHQEDHEDIIRMLPALLRDEEFQQPLLAEGGTVDLIAQHVTGALGREYRDERRLFTESDVLHDDWVSRHQRMGEVAGELYACIQEDALARSHVIEWINLNLDAAEQRLLGLGSDDLTQLMMDVREELARRDCELVVFVEDFAKTEGIQAELLNALQTRPEQGGRRLCVLRSVIACTTGYYSKLDETARGRVDFAVNLDTDYTDRNGASLAKFAARYLNAIRVDESVLKEWYSSATTGDAMGEERPPVQCSQCTYQGECHSAFRPVDGIGLYPFNRRALARLYSLATQLVAFNPRVLLNDVLLKVLKMTDDLGAGRFPGASLLPPGEGQMDAGTQAELRRRIPAEARDRYRVLLELWADPTRIGSLPASVREAFGLVIDSDLGRDEAEEKPDEESPDRHTTGSAASEAEPGPGSPEQLPVLPDKSAQTLSGLNVWANGGSMSQAVLQDLRDQLALVTAEYVDWDTEMLLKGDFRGPQAPFRAASINFQDQRPRPTGKFHIWLPFPGWERPEIAVALQAMVKYLHYGNWQFPGGENDYFLYADFLHDFSRYALQRLREDYGSAGDVRLDPVRACVELLTVGACLRGAISKTDVASADLVAAIMHDWSDYRIEHTNAGSPSWDQLCEAFRLLGPQVRGLLLARVGCTKGGWRDVQIIDAAAVLPVAMDCLKRGEVPRPLPEGAPAAYDPVVRLQKKVDQLLISAVDQASAQLASWSQRVRQGLGDGLDAQSLVQSVELMLREANAEGIGVGNQHEQQQLLELGREFAGLSLPTQVRWAEQMPKRETLLGRLQLLASEPLRRCMGTSGAYLARVNAGVETIRRRLSTDLEQALAAMEDSPTVDQVNAELGGINAIVSGLCSRGEEHA